MSRCGKIGMPRWQPVEIQVTRHIDAPKGECGKKHQTSNSKLQGNSKLQAFKCGRACGLRLGVSLVLEVWCLEFSSNDVHRWGGVGVGHFSRVKKRECGKKHQTSNSKLQGNSKLQAFKCGRACGLRLGVWCLEFSSNDCDAGNVYAERREKVPLGAVAARLSMLQLGTC